MAASQILYPPVLDTYQPTFDCNKKCVINFSLSKYSSVPSSSIADVHISVVKQKTGRSVVKKTEQGCRAGIIIQNFPQNSNKIEIDGRYIQGGWIAGEIYKVQIRFSTVDYNYENNNDITSWLTANSGKFSEWSSYTIVKATNQSIITIEELSWNSERDNDINSISIRPYNQSTLELNCIYSNSDISEQLYAYSFNLYESSVNPSDGEIIKETSVDSSNIIYQGKYNNPNRFGYLFSYELVEDKYYILDLQYETINKYIGNETIYFKLEQDYSEQSDVYLETIDSDVDNYIGLYTSLQEEEEEGRIALKIRNKSNGDIFTGNFCIRRSDSTTNFKKWTDITIINCNGVSLNELDVIYDYTIESGVYYKYGIQETESNGNRLSLKVIDNPIKRDFEYSYLLGEDGKQLKLMFNNEMGDFKYNVADSKNDTIGNKYTTITRNGNMYYRVFPITGLISFHMDEQQCFLSRKKILGGESDIVQLYNDIAENTYLSEQIKEEAHNKNIIEQYNETGAFYYSYDGNYNDIFYEKVFRDKVLEFLYDGKPKLFKSPTEGNIIVRLIDISCSPNKTLNRMVYSFSSTANEIMEPTMTNYLNNGFYKVGEYENDFSVTELKLGQIVADLDLREGRQTDIIKLIYDKYDSRDRNISGFSYKIQKIQYLSINFEDKPLKMVVKNNGYSSISTNNNTDVDEILLSGYKIKFSQQDGDKDIFIHAYAPRRYDIDSSITLNDSNSITVYRDKDNAVTTMHVTVDFLYEVKRSVYQDKKIKSSTSKRLVGQLFNWYLPDTNLYTELRNRYNCQTSSYNKYVSNVFWICIEANPGTVFIIRDSMDDAAIPDNQFYHVINDTGVLNIEDISKINKIQYVGIYDKNNILKKTLSDGNPLKSDILMNYGLYVKTDEYEVN